MQKENIEKNTDKPTVEQRLLDAGWEGSKYLIDYDYESALIGVTTNGRTVYDYNKMVEYLVNEEDFDDTEAVEWIDYNTIRALPYMGSDGPIVMYRLDEE